MGITYDPMTGEPIETPDEVIEETTTAVENISEDKENSATASETVTENNEKSASASEITVENDCSAIADEENVEKTALDTEIADSSDESAETNMDNQSIPGENDNIDLTDKEVINIEMKKGMDPGKLWVPVVAALAIVCILCVCLFSGMFVSKKQKVINAVKNTAKVDSALLEDSVKFLSVLNESDYTFSYKIEGDSVGSVDGSVIVTPNEKQLTIDADIKEAVPFTVLGQIDKETVKVEIPKLSDYVYSYNYREEKDGYIVDIAGENVIEQIDKSLETIYDNKSTSKDFQKKMVALNSEYINQLEFESAEPETYKVNGKKVECKGYVVSIENDWMVDYFDDFSDLYLSQIEESFDGISDISDISSLEDELKDLKKQLKNVPDIEITFYIYKNALACIHVDAGKRADDIDILFRGGDFRAQSIVVEVDEEEVLSFKQTKKNDKEVYKVKSSDAEVKIEYNTKKGNISIFATEGRKNYEYECKLTSDDGCYKLSIDDFEIPYTDTFDMEFSVKKGSKLMKFENEDEFDIGNADKHEFNEIINDVNEDFTDGLSQLF